MVLDPSEVAIQIAAILESTTLQDLISPKGRYVAIDHELQVVKIIGFGIWLVNINRVQFASKYTCRLLFRAGFFGLPTSQGSLPTTQVIYLDCLARDCKNSQQNKSSCYWTQRTKKSRYKIARRFKWSEDQVYQVEQLSTFLDKAISREIRATQIEHPKKNCDRVSNSTRSPPTYP